MTSYSVLFKPHSLPRPYRRTSEAAYSAQLDSARMWRAKGDLKEAEMSMYRAEYIRTMYLEGAK
jgi:hypothetical protein